VCSRFLLTALLLLLPHSIALAKNCRIVTVLPVSFGNYDPMLSGNLDTTGSIQLRCSKNTPNVSVKIDAGTSGSFVPRYMQGPSDQLAYNLYLDASRTTIWGDGTSGTSIAFFPTIGRLATLPIYARTPLGQSVGPGAYADSVVVTVEW